MTNIEVKRNDVNLGFWADFNKGEKSFYADLCDIPFIGSECMIFEYDKKGNVKWSGVYCKREIPVTEQSLLDCIEEFLNEEILSESR